MWVQFYTFLVINTDFRGFKWLWSSQRSATARRLKSFESFIHSYGRFILEQIYTFTIQMLSNRSAFRNQTRYPKHLKINQIFLTIVWKTNFFPTCHLLPKHPGSWDPKLDGTKMTRLKPNENWIGNWNRKLEVNQLNEDLDWNHLPDLMAKTWSWMITKIKMTRIQCSTELKVNQLWGSLGLESFGLSIR